MTLPPGDHVRVTVTVRAPPEVAFRVFTEETDLWWRHGPAYRVAGRLPGVLAFEPGVGGRLVERFPSPAGPREHVAGTILAWDPPSRLCFEWRAVNFAAHERTEVELRFEPTASGGTRVTLTHTGLAALRPDHPVKHGRPHREFLADLGGWWGGLLAALRLRIHG